MVFPSPHGYSSKFLPGYSARVDTPSGHSGQNYAFTILGNLTVSLSNLLSYQGGGGGLHLTKSEIYVGQTFCPLECPTYKLDNPTYKLDSQKEGDSPLY